MLMKLSCSSVTAGVVSVAGVTTTSFFILISKSNFQSPLGNCSSSELIAGALPPVNLLRIELISIFPTNSLQTLSNLAIGSIPNPPSSTEARNKLSITSPNSSNPVELHLSLKSFNPK